MIIGVDAGAISITDERLKVGVYRVTVNLLKQLSAIDQDNTYRLYSFQPISHDILDEFGPNMRNIVLRPSTGWFTIRLPVALRLHSVDIFLGLSQAIPRSTAYTIGFIYDLGFLHEPKAYPDSSRRLKKQTDDLIKRSNHIIAISRATRRDIQSRYAATGKSISVCYPGVDERFTPQGKVFYTKNPYFLFVGSLKRGKKIPAAIRAFAQFLALQKRPFDFLLIGSDYWLDPDIARSISERNLQSRVRLLGFVPDSELPLYCRGAIAFVSSALWEGFCLPAVEAMACGCPVIGFSSGALPEIVGKGGVLVKPESIDELATAMIAMTHDATRQKYGASGVKQAKLFTWRGFAECVFSAIASAQKA